MNKEGWEVKKLGEICETSSGGTPNKNISEYYDGNIPWLRSGEVANKNITETELYITQLGMSKSSAKMFPIDTVVVAMYGATVGQVGILKIPTTTNQAVCGILPNKNVLPDFLYYFFISHKEKYISQAIGGAQPNISQTIIKNTNIALPPLAIQEQIVKELDVLNDIIAKKKEQLVELDTLAQATFYDMFGDPVKNEKGWECVFIKDCLYKQTTINPQKEPQRKIKYIDVSSVSNESLSIIGYNDVLGIDAPSRARKLIKKDDVLFATIRPTLKRIAIVNEIYDNEVCSTGFMVLRTKNNLNKYYLFNCLIQKSILSYIEQLQTGASYPAISEKVIENINLPLPPLSLQNQFAERIEAIEKQKELINKSIKEVQQLFDYTMDKYFN